MAVRYLLLLVIIPAVLVVMFFTPPAHANPWVKDTKHALNEMTAGQRPCADLTASYANGSGYVGWHFVTIENGSVLVRQTRPGKKDRVFEAALAESECKAIAKLSVAGKLWTVRPTRKWGKPDETLPRISIGVQGVGSFMVSQWMTDVRKTRGFARVQRVLLSLEKRVQSDSRKAAAKKRKSAPRS